MFEFAKLELWLKSNEIDYLRHETKFYEELVIDDRYCFKHFFYENFITYFDNHYKEDTFRENLTAIMCRYIIRKVVRYVY